VLWMVVATAVAGGCEGIVGPGGDAEIEVMVEGGGGFGGEGGPSYSQYGSSSAENEGSVDIRARVYVEGATGGWREVTRGWAEQRVGIEGRDGIKILARGRVERGDFGRVRVEFERIEAHVGGELQLDLGLLSGEVRVDGGSDGRVIVERDVALSTAEGRGRISVALNAAEWIKRTQHGSQTVTEADFRGAVRIVAE
jgi:hypothetical protein